MKKLFILFLIVSILCSCSPIQKQNGPESTNIRYKVPYIRTVDGDTIVVLYNGEERKVRLIGINCEESVADEEYLSKTNQENTDNGKAASEWTNKFLTDISEVELEFDTIQEDNYGRLLAYVYVDGVMLNEEILKSGYANLMTIEPNTRYSYLFEKDYNERN